ncbi:AAA family ATPase [Bacillus cereus]|uniref:AAA family ATPase n=1 Tax=Bacillus cereus TaxID=1396 RepID=UPI00211D4075|nr:AAA family ATPase [Bacillus cereus]
MNLPKNQILYGPPGTGKTYSVVRKALEIVDPDLHQQLIENNADRKEWMDVYQRYTGEKQIQFCTFHQSYSYEDFVEGLRSDAEGNFRPTNGIFLDICKEAMESNKIITPTYEFDEEETEFYKMSLGKKDIDNDIYQYCINNNVVAIGFGDELNFSACDTEESIGKLVTENYKGKDKKSTVIKNIDKFKHSLEIDDIVVISYGNSYIRAIGRITGEYEYEENTGIRYNHFRSVEWIYSGKVIPVEEILINGKFNMQSLYNIRKTNLNLEALQERISTVEITQETKMKNYVLIMDEINRGNISRIFGELITLIEDDKRIGKKNEIFVKLPYSRKKFGVPSNLYLIGTMNTADRSITLMDTALRRRFEFIEMVPNVSLLPEDIDGINVKKLVHTINQRIEYLYDRDHTIGHAFFLCNDLSETELINIMKKKVIPLLQEYFYDDWEKIEMILGGAASDDSSSYFLKKEIIKPADIFTGLNNHYLEEQVKYSIVPQPNKQALMNVYKGQNS